MLRWCHSDNVDMNSGSQITTEEAIQIEKAIQRRQRVSISVQTVYGPWPVASLMVYESYPISYYPMEALQTLWMTKARPVQFVSPNTRQVLRSVWVGVCFHTAFELPLRLHFGRDYESTLNWSVSRQHLNILGETAFAFLVKAAVTTATSTAYI